VKTRKRRGRGEARALALRRVSWGREMKAIADYLRKNRPEDPLPSVSKIAQDDNDPFRVLVSTIISARTKDEVTSSASQRLLMAAPTPAALSACPESRIARLIYPAGFFRVKAKNLRETARTLILKFGGRVPSRMEDLLSLPGVGRKTANLVRNLGFGLAGICVDTHVHRVSNRLGWVASRSPVETERALEKRLPEKYWIPVNELLVRFGKAVCTPMSPWCGICPASSWCPRVGVGASR
jgi:endonuclease-3